MLAIALIIGTVCMEAVMLICCRWYGFSVWKVIPSAMMLTIVGFLSVMLMYYIENGKVGGLSFFGAVLFVPVFWIVIAGLLRLPYKLSLDMTAPSICIMLAIMKLECLRSGCCTGRFLYQSKDGVAIYFPSRQVECANAIILMLVLMHFIRKGKYKERIYPVFMILFGTTRFILNWFRYTEKMFLFHIPAGNFWTVVSICVGILWISIENSRRICLEQQKQSI
jgi:prolipoprotein diacylglyceryltransferase